MISADIHIISALLVRNLFVVLVLGTWLVFIKKENILEELKEKYDFYLPASFFSVVCNTGGYAMSLMYLSAPEAIIVHYTYPLFTVFASLYVTHERPGAVDYIAGLLIICGAYIGAIGPVETSGTSFLGIIWGFVSVCGMTLLVLFTRRKAKKYPVNQYMLLFFSNLIGGSFLFACKTFFAGWQDIFNFTPLYFVVTIFQAAVSTLAAYAFFYSAFNYIPAALVSIITSFEIIMVLSLSFLITRVAPTTYEIAGSLLIILAIACAAVMGGLGGKTKNGT